MMHVQISSSPDQHICASTMEFGRLILTPDFQGIWSGMIGGTAVQTLILAYLTVKCDWDEEVRTVAHSHLL